MKVIQVHLGLLPIPPNGWGAVEKIIWEYHQNLNKKGIPCEIKYLNDIKYSDDTIVHVHVANLANECYKRGIPYIFTIHDHHAYLYGKDSHVFKENLEAIENSIISTCPAKYLVDYFGSKKLRYFSHAVNTDQFAFQNKNKSANKLLCVANNGYANDQSSDRKGFQYAIQAAKDLDLPITIAGPSNNKKFFEKLENVNSTLSNYSKLNKVFDLNEKELIDLYNDHSIFIHASELEAGHPNLTLLEAMSCGLPVVGTFENNKYDGMIVIERDIDQIKNAVGEVLSNYEVYQKNALNSAKNNSYDIRVDQLIELYDEYTEKLFAYKFVSVYNSINKNIKEFNNKPRFSVSFNDKAKIEIENPSDPSEEFNIKFKDISNNSIKYECNLKHGWWGACNFNYYIPYNIEVSDRNKNVIYDYTLNLENKSVLIEYDSSALGDQLAWLPIMDQFRKKHKCNLSVKIPLPELFKKTYPDIKFVNTIMGDYFAIYKPGWYVDHKNGVNTDRHRNDPRKLPLQKIASDYLGLEYIPERPVLDFEIKNKPVDKKYVVIATQSTSQAKYWNNPGGWEKVVEYIKNKYDFEVMCIDLNKIYGNGTDYINQIPSNALDFTGKQPLADRMNQLYHSEFFIGLPSGLSWLAWALNKPVVLISGFSYPYTEFNTPYRVQNHSVCTGCWNDEYFDKSDWKWCPKPNKKELFECTKSITPEMVYKTIDKLILKKNL